MLSSFEQAVIIKAAVIDSVAQNIFFVFIDSSDLGLILKILLFAHGVEGSTAGKQLVVHMQFHDLRPWLLIRLFLFHCSLCLMLLIKMSCLTIGDKDTNKLVKICHPPLKYVNRVKKKTPPNLPLLWGRIDNSTRKYGRFLVECMSFKFKDVRRRMP